MSSRGLQSSTIGRAFRAESLFTLALKPFVLVPLFVVAAIAVATLPSLFGYVGYGQQALERQIDQEDGALCQKFGMQVETRQFTECTSDLADLRHRHEALLLH